MAVSKIYSQNKINFSNIAPTLCLRLMVYRTEIFVAAFYYSSGENLLELLMTPRCMRQALDATEVCFKRCITEV